MKEITIFVFSVICAIFLLGMIVRKFLQIRKLKKLSKLQGRYTIYEENLFELEIEVNGNGIVTWCSKRPSNKDHWSVGRTFKEVKTHFHDGFGCVKIFKQDK